MLKEKPTPNWVRLYLPELLRGFFITSWHFWINLLGFIPGLDRLIKKEVVTYQWPEVERPIADRWRGKHRHNRREDGSTKCVACFCCSTVCPAQCITIEAGETEAGAWTEKTPTRFEINLFECVYCGMCVEACPCDAIYMDRKEMRMCEYTPDKFVIGLKELLR